jgi:hypothetical protein
MAMTIVVRDLKGKLKILREMAEPSLSRADIVTKLGIHSDSTLRWYESGSETRAPGTLPSELYKKLIDLFRETLPGERSTAEVTALLDGPTTAVKDAFLSGTAVIWWRLVENAAVRTGARLLREADMEFGFVEVEGPEDPEPIENVVALGERFCLIFSVPKDGYTMVLQLAQKAWAGVAFATGDYVLEIVAGDLVVPGEDADDRRYYLVENRDPGRHRFVCVCSPIPFPSVTQDALAHGVLDRTCLDRLASFYKDLRPSAKHMVMLDVRVEKPSRRAR